MADTVQLHQQSSSLLSQQGHGSLGDIYHRLRSYSATTWFGKPPQLSAQECAGKGWTNTGPDQLTCLSCGSQILCKLPINPYSEAAAGIVGKYTQRLVEAHSANCRQRSLDQPAQSARSSIGFPVVDPQRLSTAYRSRLQELQHIQSLPSVRSLTTGQLAAVAARLDPSILSGLAAILHTPEDSLKQEAAASVTASSTTAVSAGSSTYLSREQAQVLIALCGWQPKQLLPPHLAPAAAADTSGTIHGIAHLLPRRGASSGGHAAGHAASAGSTISPACTALECELCGSQVGLWKFSCSGPFYAQQLSSKAMRALTAATAQQAAVPGPSTAALPPAAANGVAGTSAQAGSDQAAQPTAAVGTDGSRAQGLKRAHSEPAAGGGLSPKAQQQQGGGQTSASPEAVFSTLTHTIAGGSLLTAGAAGAKGCNSCDVCARQPGLFALSADKILRAGLCAVIASSPTVSKLFEGVIFLTACPVLTARL
jgi:hypothetical protein